MSGTSIGLIVVAGLAAMFALHVIAKLFKYLVVGLLTALVVAVVVVHPHIGKLDSLLPKSMRGTATTIEHAFQGTGHCLGSLGSLTKTNLRVQPSHAEERAQSAKIDKACAPIRSQIGKQVQGGINDITGQNKS